MYWSNMHIDSSLNSKISAQLHTTVKQICFPSGNVFFLSLFSLSKNWMHNVVWSCAEILLMKLQMIYGRDFIPGRNVPWIHEHSTVLFGVGSVFTVIERISVTKIVTSSSRSYWSFTNNDKKRQLVVLMIRWRL